VHELILSLFLRSLVMRLLPSSKSNCAGEAEIEPRLQTTSLAVFTHVGNNRSASSTLPESPHQQAKSNLTPITTARCSFFEAVKPSHACLPALGIGGKDAMLSDPFGNYRTSSEVERAADAGASSVTALQVGPAKESASMARESKCALVTNQIRKFAGQDELDMFFVIGF